MEEFIALNQQAIFNKISLVRQVDGCYCCSDLINALSDAVVRDLRLINDYDDTQVIIKKITNDKQGRNMRFFTITGIHRYLHEGKIYSYNNACAYFKVSPINKDHKKWIITVNKCIVDNLFISSKILRWLFEKKKSSVVLGERVDYKTLTQWLKTASGYNDERANWLIENYKTNTVLIN